jgi:hypothetical protein
MQKSKINIEPVMLDAISSSTKLNPHEKMSFLRYVGYMTISEKRELIRIL